MADEVDQAQSYSEAELARNLAAVRAAADIPAGLPGECDFCGEHTTRLIGGACAPCRDRWGRP